jgi:hypothetical protein
MLRQNNSFSEMSIGEGTRFPVSPLYKGGNSTCMYTVAPYSFGLKALYEACMSMIIAGA